MKLHSWPVKNFHCNYIILYLKFCSGQHNIILYMYDMPVSEYGSMYII